MTKTLIRICIGVAVALAAWAVIAQDTKPAEVLKKISELRTATLTAARTNNTTVDAAKMQREIDTLVQVAIAGVDIAKVDANDAYDWAQLFSMAKKHKETCELCHKFLTTKPNTQTAFQAKVLMLSSCNALGEADMMLATLSEMKPYDKNSALMMASMTASLYADTIAAKKGPEEAIKLLDRTLAEFPPAEGTDQEKGRRDSVFAVVIQSKAELLEQLGRNAEALQTINAALEMLEATSPAHRNLTAIKTKMSMTGTAAPALSFGKTYGWFTSLADLKGKVVLIDFFAHWCGPCKASFPDMRKLYDDLKGKGLEIVGVTRYYGYYGAEKNLSEATEYEKMAGFLKEFNMNWPIVFGGKENFEAYGVTGIPTVAVIDKSGKVHSFKVGYLKEHFPEFRSKIEKLLGK